MSKAVLISINPKWFCVAKDRLNNIDASGIPITLEFIFYLAKEYGVEL